MSLREYEIVHRTLHYLIGEIPAKTVLEAVAAVKWAGSFNRFTCQT